MKNDGNNVGTGRLDERFISHCAYIEKKTHLHSEK